MTEIATIDCFGDGGHLFSLKTLPYFLFIVPVDCITHQLVSWNIETCLMSHLLVSVVLFLPDVFLIKLF